MSEIRKQKKIKGGEAYLGSSTVRPSQLAGPASSRPSPPPSSVVFVPTEGGECGRRARAPPRHATSLPACLPSPPRLDAPGRRHASPLLSLTLPRFLPPLPCSLSHGRTPPSPPLAITTATGPPSLPRQAQRLRLDPLFPLHRPTALRKPCSVALKIAPNLRPPANFRGFASSSPSPASPLPLPDPL